MEKVTLLWPASAEIPNSKMFTKEYFLLLDEWKAIKKEKYGLDSYQEIRENYIYNRDNKHIGVMVTWTKY